MSNFVNCISTVEMHTGGEPFRIVETEFPSLMGDTLLEKRTYVREKFDNLRKVLMREPRGHFDMYGCLLVRPDNLDADIAVLFMHNEGYSTMCGHGVIALGRYVVDNKLVSDVKVPTTVVKIQCPCGIVKAFVDFDGQHTGCVCFHSVPAYLFCADIELHVSSYSSVKIDVAFGGAFYVYLAAQTLGLDLFSTPVQNFIKAATEISEAAKEQITLSHPDSDLAFLYGVVFTDGLDEYSNQPTANITVFADRQVDRSPCGSACTGLLALQYFKKKITVGQKRTFMSAVTKTCFSGEVLNESKFHEYDAVVCAISGKSYYTGKAQYFLESDDPLQEGFLVT